VHYTLVKPFIHESAMSTILTSEELGEAMTMAGDQYDGLYRSEVGWWREAYERMMQDKGNAIDACASDWICGSHYHIWIPPKVIHVYDGCCFSAQVHHSSCQQKQKKTKKNKKNTGDKDLRPLSLRPLSFWISFWISYPHSSPSECNGPTNISRP